MLDDGTIEIGFRGDDAASARLLREAVSAGLPIVTFARAASDLEELFLQVTAPAELGADRAERGARHETCHASIDPPGRPLAGPGFGGISAIGAKELRGRMRGRRAFVALTFYLGLLAGFAWMLEALQAARSRTPGSAAANYQSAQIGTGIFAGLLILADAPDPHPRPGVHDRRDQPGAREADARPARDDADLVAVDVLGKLFSALAWAFLLSSPRSR